MSTFLRLSKIPLRNLRGGKFLLLHQEQNVTRNILLLSTQIYSKYYTTQEQFKSNLKHASKMNNIKPLEINLSIIQKNVYNYEIIDINLLKSLISQLKNSEYMPESYILFLIHSCGNAISYTALNTRHLLLENLWNSIQNCGNLDVSIYNALLQIYTENKKIYSPFEILSEMKHTNIEPNRVTFEKMIHYCCEKGDIKIATELLALMNEKQIPISQNIFNSLIIGHAEIGDIDNAVKMLDIMKTSGIEHDANTYCSLIRAYVKIGNIEKMNEVLKECQTKEIYLSDSHFVKIIEDLANHNHLQHIKEIKKLSKNTKRFIMELIAVMFHLVEKNHLDAAFEVLKCISLQQINFKSREQIINAFVEPYIKLEKPQLLEILEYISKTYYFPQIYLLTWHQCIKKEQVNLTLQVLKTMKINNVEINDHLFWPLLCIHRQNLNVQGATKIIQDMISKFQISPSIKTLSSYYIPMLTGKINEILFHLKNSGIDNNKAVNALIMSKLITFKFNVALIIAKSNPSVALHPAMITYMAPVLYKYNDAETYVNFARYVKENHDDKYTLSDDVELFEEVPENINLNDFIAMEAVKSVGNIKINIIQPVFELMKEEGLGISKNSVENIKKLIPTSSNEINLLLDELSSGNLQPKAITYPFYNEKIQLYQEFFNQCRKGNIEDAQRTMKVIEEQGYEISPGLHVELIKELLNQNKLAEAKEYINKKTSGIYFNSGIIKKLALSLIRNGDINDAMQYIEEKCSGENKHVKNIALNIDLQICEEIAKLNDENLQHKIINILTPKNETPQYQILKPFINFHLKNDDLDKAIQTFEKFNEKYNALPLKFNLLCECIMKEDAVKLQKVTALYGAKLGENKTLLDLSMAFLKCGKINSAKKILMTPGLRIDIHSLSNIILNFYKRNEIDHLNKFIDMTKNLNYISRQQLYDILLNPCIKNNDWERGLTLWEQMQEENVISSESFLNSLASLLIKNNKEVPFVSSLMKSTNTLASQMSK